MKSTFLKKGDAKHKVPEMMGMNSSHFPCAVKNKQMDVETDR